MKRHVCYKCGRKRYEFRMTTSGNDKFSGRPHWFCYGCITIVSTPGKDN